MKKNLFILFFIAGLHFLSFAQIVDITNVDIQTNTVKTIKDVDKSIRPTGFCMTFGVEAQYPFAAAFDVGFVGFQATPQFYIGVIELSTGTQIGGNMSFTYFASPKLKSSFMCTLRPGILVDLWEDDVCLRMQFGIGHAWKYFYFEGIVSPQLFFDIGFKIAAGIKLTYCLNTNSVSNYVSY